MYYRLLAIIRLSLLGHYTWLQNPQSGERTP